MRQTDDLTAILVELDELIRVEHPEHYSRFRPGLPQAEVERMADRLKPYYLPHELTTLYCWHDGWDDRVNSDYEQLFLFDAGFCSFAEAIDQYEVWWRTFGSNGWHPLWFPAFGSDYKFGELVALQLEPGRSAGQVFSFDAESDLSTSFDSVTTLFATVFECWRRGLSPREDPLERPAELRRELGAITRDHNPLSRDADGLRAREISVSSTADWPTAWKQVLGIGPMTPEDDELAITIAEFLADPSRAGPIRADLRPVGAAGDTDFATASDGTGSLKVLLRRKETENCREYPGKGRFELWLAPTNRESFEEYGATMIGFDRRPGETYLATRIVPL
jgi:cell wall assembly regulator SMI1